MSYRIIHHDLIEADLLDITLYISSYAGPAIGKAKVDAITDFISNLADYPKIGTVHDEFMPGMRAIPAGEKAVVCFTVDDERMTVLIVCISYAGSDWQARVKSRI